MQKIAPHIWCSGNAEEVARAYASIFPDARFEVESRYPEHGLLPFQEPLAGEPLTVALTIAGTRLTLINAGDDFSPNPSISFMLNFDPTMFDGDESAAAESLDALWQKLVVDGNVLLPLKDYPFSKRYGWVEDRFGVSWQLILTDPAGDPRPFLMPALLFGGPAQNKARESVERYVSLFPDAEVGNVTSFEEAMGPAVPGAVMFCDFRIGDQWFVAMDSGEEQNYSFTCGVSLEVSCADQAEIDHFWNALSSVPEAEQCGWLADQAGVSWQIVPENMGALMERPGAFDHMMQMKKLVIADF